jgi:metal-sulfur cluster biosynthetic enzyme
MSPALLAERQNEVYRRLREVIDPEIGVSIIKLGLVYDIAIDGGDVTVVMTLTTRGCPLGHAITEGVRRKVAPLAWVTNVTVHLVWDPPWDPAMIR